MGQELPAKGERCQGCSTASRPAAEKSEKQGSGQAGIPGLKGPGRPAAVKASVLSARP